MEVESRQGNIAVLLANRAYLYRLLQNLFGNSPTPEAIQILTSEYTQTSLSLLSIEESFEAVKDFAEQFADNKKEALEKASSEYTRLFIGPAKLPAPPWESVYVTKERLIFQESTLRVRQCYLKYHYLPVHYRSEADDHIALELDFMYNLSHMAEAAFEEGKIDEVIERLKDQKAFLVDHLLVWVPQYVSILETATNHPLFKGMALILEKLLKVDLLVIDELLDTL
jgi:TorA maturation chaperone TorD